MKILVTGGAGFIGHNVVRVLEQHGHECIVIDNFTDYGFIPRKELTYLSNARINRFNAKVIHTDIQHTGHMFRIFEEHSPDIVIHLASFPRQKIVNTDPITGSKVMSTGLLNLLEAAKQNNVKKFVYISSSMVYGDFTETDPTEDAPCNPIGQYGILKLAGEWLVKDYARKSDLSYTIIRPSAVYGEWDVNDRVVSKFVATAIQGKTLKVNGANEILDFTYVEDAAAGIAQAALSSNADNNTYNITRSDLREWTLLEAAELAVSLAGKGNIEVASRDLDFPKRGRLCIDRAIKDFNYSPVVNVTEGFNRYYEWYMKNPSLLN